MMRSRNGLLIPFMMACGPVVVGSLDTEGSSPSSESADVADSVAETDASTVSASASTTDAADDSTTEAEDAIALPDFVAFGDALQRIVSFDDGASWTTIPEPAATPEHTLMGATRGDGRIVAVGGASTFVTGDGTIWHSFETALGVARSVAFGHDTYVSVGFHRRARSTDAVGWIDETGEEPQLDLTSIAFGNGRFVAVGKGGMSTSVDGRTWVTTPLDDPPVTTVAYGSGVFLAMGYEGRVVQTADGETLLEDLRPSDATVTSVCAFRNGFVAALGSGALRHSEDGLVWSEVTLPNAHAVACGTDTIVAVGAHQIHRGSDIASMQLVFESDVPLHAVAYTGTPPDES